MTNIWNKKGDILRDFADIKKKIIIIIWQILCQKSWKLNEINSQKTRKLIKTDILKLIIQKKGYKKIKYCSIYSIYSESIPTNKIIGPDGFIDKFIQISQEKTDNLNPKIFQNIKKKGIIISLFYRVKITLISTPDKNMRREESYRPITLMNMDVKNNFKKFTKQPNNKYVKRIIHHYEL